MKKALFALAMGALVAACGGGDDDGGGFDCSFNACGGDPVATWTIAGSCTLGDQTIEECPEATFDDSGIEQDGTVTINSDGTYSTSVTTTGTVQFTFPLSCLGGATCDQLEGAVEGVTCTDTGEACDCTQTLNETDNETGTYVASGSTVTFTPDGGGTPDELEFCVEGNTMKASAPPEMAGDARAIVFLTK